MRRAGPAQGTNKPAHYHVLLDEIGFGADGVQLLAYWMCYLMPVSADSAAAHRGFPSTQALCAAAPASC
jgi:hypothetical protein